MLQKYDLSICPIVQGWMSRVSTTAAPFLAGRPRTVACPGEDEEHVSAHSWAFSFSDSFLGTDPCDEYGGPFDLEMRSPKFIAEHIPVTIASNHLIKGPFALEMRSPKILWNIFFTPEFLNSKKLLIVMYKIIILLFFAKSQCLLVICYC
jgi:hypothetical protein